MKALRLRAEPRCAHGSPGPRARSAREAWKNPRLGVEEIAKPAPGPGELLIRVSYCGLCGSDFHLTEPSGAEQAIAYPGLARLPVTLGHEFSGTVEALGSGIPPALGALFATGTPVTAEEMLWCGDCPPCRSGLLNHCENLEELGFTVDGAHAEYVVVPARHCWTLAPLATELGTERALQLGALVEPYSVSFRALFLGAGRGAWIPGGRVLVVGCGPIGLAALDLALLGGAACVDAFEPVPARQQLARRLGARQVLAPAELPASLGSYDWIVDAAGDAPLIQLLAGKHLAIGGSLALLARSEEPRLALEPEALITRNARVFGSQGHSGDGTFGRVIQLFASGRLRAGELIERLVPIEEAHRMLASGKRSGGKTLVQPG